MKVSIVVVRKESGIIESLITVGEVEEIPADGDQMLFRITTWKDNVAGAIEDVLFGAKLEAERQGILSY